MPVLLIVGLAALVLGLVLFFVWFSHILALIQALLPLAFIVGGAVAAYLGWEEMRERGRPKMDFSNPDEASRYKAEAKAYQAELNEMKTDPQAPAETAEEPAGRAEESPDQTGERPGQ